MTVIAWDGMSIAADKRALNEYRPITVTKLFRVPDGSAILAVSGELSYGMVLVGWYSAGADPEKWPHFQRDKDEWVALICVKKDGLYRYERTPIPHKIHDPFYAVGSGRDYALAAMYLGKSAKEAVEVTNALSAACGNGVDVMSLEDAS